VYMWTVGNKPETKLNICLSFTPNEIDVTPQRIAYENVFVTQKGNQPIGGNILTKKENRRYVITAAIGVGLLVAALVTFLVVQASGNASGLPTAPPGVSYYSMVRFKATVAGDVAGFDEEMYKSGVASLLEGIQSRDVRVSVTPGSVIVDTSVKASGNLTTQTLIELFDYDAESFSDAINFTVTELTTPYIALELFAYPPPLPPPSPPPPPPPPSSPKLSPTSPPSPPSPPSPSSPKLSPTSPPSPPSPPSPSSPKLSPTSPPSPPSPPPSAYWTQFAHIGTTMQVIGSSAYNTALGSQTSNDTVWWTSCSAAQDLSGSTNPAIKLTMGSVVDYFRPMANHTLCDMLSSFRKHDWSNDGVTWRTPDHQTANMGGSEKWWPRDHVEGDERWYLSMWGAGTGNIGSTRGSGCCHRALNDNPEWSRTFDMYVNSV